MMLANSTKLKGEDKNPRTNRNTERKRKRSKNVRREKRERTQNNNENLEIKTSSRAHKPSSKKVHLCCTWHEST
jgi:hypothetical protein